VHKEDFKEAERELKEMLNLIIEKLERKDDK
jgi:predicted RNase H-like HicB family nuclease